MEKLAGDLLLGQRFVRLEILSTSFTDFLYGKLGELSSRSLGLKGINPLKGLVTVDSPQGLFMGFYGMDLQWGILKQVVCYKSMSLAV